MKKILFLLLLISCQLSFAQLTVRDNAYIFVTDEVLYVEDDIDLTEATSTVYLRNEAQLIQGPGNTGNSGLGRLSVYQEGTSNNYSYNYWSSPVGNVSNNTTGNRTFIPNQNIFKVDDLTNSTLAGYATSGYNGTSTAAALNIESYWLWKYSTGTAYSNWVFVGQSGFVDSGYGFSMKGVIGATALAGQQYDYRGKPNEGEIMTNLESGELTLIGNPYPSALDAALFIHDTNNASLLDAGSLYYWEHDQTVASHILVAYRGGYGAYTISNTLTGNFGSYVAPTFDSYNADGTLATTGAASGTGKQARRFIPIGQGFMVKGSATAPASSTLLTSDSHRVYEKESGANSEFFRASNAAQTQTNTSTQYTEDGFEIMPLDVKRFRLNVDFNDLYTRQLLQNFHVTATSGDDYGMESKAFSLLAKDAHWTQNNEAYVTQANAFEIDLKIPVILNLNEQQLIRFRIIDVQNFDANQEIYIHDIENDTYVDLRQQNFEINLPSGNYDNRFEITFQKVNNLSTDEFTVNDFNVVQNNNASELIVLNPNSLNIKSLELYDVSGKLIFNKLINNSNTRLSYSTKNLSDGVYLVKTILTNSNTTTKKVVITNKG